MSRTPFEVLGLTPDAEPVAIEAVYRALARKYHPDANPGVAPSDLQQRMSELNWAHDELAQDLDGWRQRTGRPGRGTLQWGAAPQVPPTATPRAERSASPPKKSGLNWGAAPPQRPTAPPPEPRPSRPPRVKTSGLNWGTIPAAPPEPEFVELEWHRRRRAAQGETAPTADGRSRTPQSARAIATNPRIVNLAGRQGASAGFTARIEGGGQAHIQCRFREGPFEIVRRGGQGAAVAFEVTITEDIQRPTTEPVFFNIDVVARDYEGTRLVLALTPQPLPPGTPWPPRRRNLDELLDADFGIVRWV